MPWVVVKFVETNEIEVLPTKWLLESGKAVCPSYGRKKLEKAIKGEEQPEPTWRIFHIQLMTNKIFDKFLKALSKANKACLTSDLSDTDIELPPKRPRKQNTLSSSEESTDESLSGFPELVSANAKVAPESQNVKSSNCNDVIGTNNTDDGSLNLINATGTASVNLSITKMQTSVDNLVKQVLTQAVKHKRILLDQEEVLKRIESKEEENSETLKEILKILQGEHHCMCSASTGQSASVLNLQQIQTKLPLSNETDFIEVENVLIGNGSVKEALIVNLMKMGGQHYKEILKIILQKLLSDHLMAQYSLVGHKKKKPFKPTQLYSATVEAAQRFDERVTLKEIEGHIAIYLSKAPERLTKRSMVMQKPTSADAGDNDNASQ